MSETLAKALVLQNAVSGAAVEDAVQRQVVHGGSLDTNLLEAGAISEAELLRVMSEAYAMPAVGKDEIDAVPEHIPRLFPQIFAETYHLVPYRLVGQNLGVLVNRPADAALFARIEERLRLFIKPAVTSEARLHYAMFRLYGVELQPRFRELLLHLDGRAELAPAAGAEPAPVLSWGLSGQVAPPPTDSRRRQPLKVSTLLGRLANASDRDAIIDVLMEAALSTFEYAAIFLVHGERVNGWRGMDPESTQRVVRVSLPVELPSVFQTIYATHGHYLGPLPNNSVNTRLVADLGREPPRTAFLAPLLVGGKLAGIIFADNGTRGVPSKRVAALLLLTHRAGMCLEGLIRKRRASTDRMLAEPEAPEGPAPLAAAEAPTVIDEGDFEPVIEAPQMPAPSPAAAETTMPPAATALVSQTAGPPLDVAAEQARRARLTPPPLPRRKPAGVESTPAVAVAPPQAPPAEPTAASASPQAPLAEPTTAVAPPPAPLAEPTAAAEAEDEGRAALWQSVTLEDLDTASVTGQFVHDTSPTATTEAFARAAEQSRPGEETVELGFEPPGDEEPPAEKPYVAFAEVDAETTEETVGGWEDVFVETVGTERVQTETPAPVESAAPPAISWDDVIAEAEAAPTLSTLPATATLEVAGKVVDEREMLLDSLDADDPEVWRTAVEKLAPMGATLDEELSRRFPGRLQVDPFAPGARLPPFSQCSGVTALLAARGAAAANVVLPFLESNTREQRFFAVYYLYAVPYPAAIELLARRLYDAEPRNRFLAADALRTYRQEAGYRRIIQGLRDHLKVPVFEAQVATVQVLGQLRDPSAVPSLIPLVLSPRQALARASASALTVISGQAFGTEVARWAQWWQTHFNKPREAWLVEGMRHPDPNVRRIAAREFQLLTGRSAPTDSGVTPEQARESSYA